jgi:hypothetical protein
VYVHADASDHEDVLTFASRPEGAEVDEADVFDCRLVDFGVFNVVDLQTKLIELVVHGVDYLIQIALHEVFDVGSRLDRQPEVHDRLQEGNVVGFSDGGGKILVVGDDRLRIILSRGRSQRFEDEGIWEVVLFDVVTE